MYGLVNKALHDMIRAHFGAERWDEIRRKAGVGTDFFVAMQSYPDAVTYRLAGAASEVLSIPMDQVLQDFGEYWIAYTAREGYGELFDFGGRSFVEFVRNLDGLHARVGLQFRDFEPPSFSCTDVTDASLRVHYFSERPGLAPFVIGLLQGLGRHFQTPVDVKLDRTRCDGHDHDEFVVTYMLR